MPYKFAELTPPTAPDYSNRDHWAALPDKKDFADVLPDDTVTDRQANAAVDVFFIHPTSFLAKDSMWNADLADSVVNRNTDEYVMKNQASVFNGSAKIYAPRYRQAHVKAYYNVENGGRDALMLAYTDVRHAFEYYLKHYNKGRPIIIASHSQGTTHAIWILKEYFDGKELADKLVAAYMPGMPVRRDSFDHLQPCTAADDLHCFLSWGTYSKGHYPESYDWWNKGAVVTNPITWSVDSGYNAKDQHLGILYYNYKFKYKNTIRVSTNNGILWMRKPSVWFKYFLWKKNYHAADYNLYWLNIRQNVHDRVQQYLKENPQSKSASGL